MEMERWLANLSVQQLAVSLEREKEPLWEELLVMGLGFVLAEVMVR